MFTAQSLILAYLVIHYLRKLASDRRDKRYFLVRGLIIVLLALWYLKVFELVQEEAKRTEADLFDPHVILGLPSTVAFNSGEVKKAYRALAVQYHPDKLADPTDEAAIARFHRIVKAYETLTDKEKHANWLKYGDPEGSKAFKAIEIALPSFLLDNENHTTVLGVFFLGFICLPIYLVYKRLALPW